MTASVDAPVHGADLAARRPFAARGLAALALAVGAIVACGGDDSPETTNATDEPTTGQDDAAITTGEAATDGGSKAAGDGDGDGDADAEVALVDQGFSSADSGAGVEGSWAAALENTGDAPAVMVPVDVTFADASGTTLTSEQVIVKSIPAGGTMGVAGEFLAGDLAAPIASMDVAVGEPSGPQDAPDGELKATGVTVGPGGTALGGVKVTFAVESTFEGSRSAADVYAVLRDAEGSIVGGAFTTTGSIAPGTSSGEVTSYMDFPGVTSAEVYLTGGLG